MRQKVMIVLFLLACACIVQASIRILREEKVRVAFDGEREIERVFYENLTRIEEVKEAIRRSELSLESTYARYNELLREKERLEELVQNLRKKASKLETELVYLKAAKRQRELELNESSLKLKKLEDYLNETILLSLSDLCAMSFAIISIFLSFFYYFKSRASTAH